MMEVQFRPNMIAVADRIVSANVLVSDPKDRLAKAAREFLIAAFKAAKKDLVKSESSAECEGQLTLLAVDEKG